MTKLLHRHVRRYQSLTDEAAENERKAEEHLRRARTLRERYRQLELPGMPTDPDSPPPDEKVSAR